MIYRRTKNALAAAKRRGVKLGCPVPWKGSVLGVKRHQELADQFARNVKPVIEEVRGAGTTTLRGQGMEGAESRVGKFSPALLITQIYAREFHSLEIKK